MNIWKPYIIAIAVGLLVGIERENSSVDQKALGVRTFLLLSLLGVMTGELESPWQVAIVTLFALGLIFTSYLIQIGSRPLRIHLGLTTEFAAGLVFIAGFISHSSPILVATLGPLVALILFSKVTLHRFTHQIRPLELKAAITILLIAAVVVDLAPNTTIDPWGLFNPQKFGYLVLILATLEFSSYILLKMIGEKTGSLVVGFLGGLVSSSAVLISSAKQAFHAKQSWRTFLCAVLIAQMASLLELLVIVSFISQGLFTRVLPAIAASLIFCGICLAFMWHKHDPQKSKLLLKSPLDWAGVFRLSVIFAFLIGLVSVAERWLGQEAILTLSFLAGLFELQGISLANATLYSQALMSLDVASQCLLLAITASLISKIATSWLINRSQFSVFMTLVFLPMIFILFMIEWFVAK